MTAPTTTLKDSLDGIGELLSASCERYHVPGAVLAVRRDDEMVEYANGVLNLTTGVETTTDSVFQIGSITKVFTTTLIMQLVDEGRLDLDSPVCTYLPEFTLANREYSAAITVRQLVTHTSGMDGDYFHDTGRGADAVERYVMSLGALPSLHAPGAMWSYCNGGFVVAGRIVEKLTGLTWDQAIEQRIFKPAGLATMGTLPEVAILSRAAAGHVMDEEGNWKRAPVWLLAPSNGPAGATPFAAARDLLTFAWTHLNGGTAEGGTRILSEKGVRAMQQEEVHLPGRGIVDHWGLGWMLFDWGPERIIGHDGGTIGQSSFLRISPEKRFGAALLTNGGNVQALSRKVLGEVFARGAGIQMAPLPEANAECHDRPGAIRGDVRQAELPHGGGGGGWAARRDDDADGSVEWAASRAGAIADRRAELRDGVPEHGAAEHADVPRAGGRWAVHVRARHAPLAPGEPLSDPTPLAVASSLGTFRVLHWGPVEGPAALFLHGLTGVAEVWGPTVTALRPGRRRYAMDQRGHGHSPKPATGYDIGNYVQDALRVIEALDLAPVAPRGPLDGRACGHGAGGEAPGRAAFGCDRRHRAGGMEGEPRTDGGRRRAHAGFVPGHRDCIGWRSAEGRREPGRCAFERGAPADRTGQAGQQSGRHRFVPRGPRRAEADGSLAPVAELLGGVAANRCAGDVGARRREHRGAAGYRRPHAGAEPARSVRAVRWSGAQCPPAGADTARERVGRFLAVSRRAVTRP